MGTKKFGLVDNWIRHIKDVYRLHQQELDSIADYGSRSNRFIELNIIEQVHDLSKTSLVQQAWEKGKRLALHGWVYNIQNGQISDLVSITGEEV